MGQYAFSLFAYFSFVTVTTLGYGDISPVGSIAQFLSITEAVIGQLYVAILIGGLVAMMISGRPGEIRATGTETDLAP